MNFARRQLIAASVALAAFAGLSSTAQAQLKELNFGVISTESSKNQAQLFGPMLKDLEKAIGIPVKAFFASDYAGVIEGMRFNKVQIAWMGNKSAMEAVDRSNGEIFVQTVAVNGDMGYYSTLVTHKDSPLNNLDDVLKNSKNLRFGIGDPNSTSGFLVPSYYVFALNNIDPKTAFKSVTTSNHEGNLLAASAKQVDVATNNTENQDRLRQTAPAKFALIKEIWRSPLIPSDPLVYRNDLSADLKKKIADFFLAYGKAAGAEGERQKAILAPLTWSGFVPSTNTQLLPIRQLELYKARTKVAGDAKKSDADKKAELAKIDAQLADLVAQMKKAGK